MITQPTDELHRLLAGTGTLVRSLEPPHPPTGCPCGCSSKPGPLDPPCVTTRPAPDRDGFCCSACPIDQVATLAEAGIYCGTGRCARRQLRGTAARPARR